MSEEHRTEDRSGGGSGNGSGEREPKATAKSYGALDTSGVDEECWMLRIPPTLAKVWDKVPQGSVLGELLFKKGDGKTKPSLMIHVAPSVLEVQEEDEDEEDDYDDEDDVDHRHPHHRHHHPHDRRRNSSNTSQQQQQQQQHALPIVPLTYSMQALSKHIPTYHPFSRNPQTGSIRIWGTVSRTGNLQVETNDENYRRQRKDRLLQTNVNSNRFVKPIDTPQSVISKQQQARRKQLANLGGGAGAGGAIGQVNGGAGAGTGAGVVGGGTTEGNGTNSEPNATNATNAVAAAAAATFSSAVSLYGKRKNEDTTLMMNPITGEIISNPAGGGPLGSATGGPGGGAGGDIDDPNANKRSRQFAPDQPIRSVIFELFSKKKYWTVKDLKTAAATGGASINKRSEAEIRDVLREIGEYHRSGDHKTMWELRNEFQQQH